MKITSPSSNLTKNYPRWLALFLCTFLMEHAASASWPAVCDHPSRVTISLAAINNSQYQGTIESNDCWESLSHSVVKVDVAPETGLPFNLALNSLGVKKNVLFDGRAYITPQIDLNKMQALIYAISSCSRFGEETTSSSLRCGTIYGSELKNKLAQFSSDSRFSNDLLNALGINIRCNDGHYYLLRGGLGSNPGQLVVGECLISQQLQRHGNIVTPQPSKENPEPFAADAR